MHATRLQGYITREIKNIVFIRSENSVKILHQPDFKQTQDDEMRTCITVALTKQTKFLWIIYIYLPEQPWLQIKHLCH